MNRATVTTVTSHVTADGDPDRDRVCRVGAQKGGTARTTTLANVGFEAARLGCKVLLIDFDPNRRLTLNQFSYDPALDGDATTSTLVRSTDLGAAGEMILEAPGPWQPRADISYEHGGAVDGTDGLLAFIPSDPSLGTVIESLTRPASERILERGLRGVSREFDLVLIDTGPQATRSAWMTAAAANHVLSVITPEDGPIGGATDEIAFVGEIGDLLELPIRYIGAVVARFNRQYRVTHGAGLARARSELARQVEDAPDSPYIRLVTHPEPGRGVGEWQSGAAVWPDVIRERAGVIDKGRTREPVASGLYAAVDPDAHYFDRRKALGFRDDVAEFTRTAVRLLQATNSPAFTSVNDFIKGTDLFQPDEAEISSNEPAAEGE